MKCSDCLHEMNATTSATPNQGKPTPGAVGLCFYCGKMYQFDLQLKLIPVTKEKEVLILTFCDPGLKRVIELWRKAIKERVDQN